MVKDGDYTFYGSRVMYKIVKLLCCIPETDIKNMSSTLQLKKKKSPSLSLPSFWWLPAVLRFPRLRVT